MENVSYVVGNRVLIGRVLPGHDFIKGIEDAFRVSGFTSGNLVSCVGSLRQASFIYIKSKPGGLMDAGYDGPTILEGPLELLSMQGPIVMEGDEVFYHFHGVVADQNGMALGGHFYREGTMLADGQRLKGGNKVLATVDFTVLAHEGARLSRKIDPQSGVNAILPEGD
ncbi:MAG: DNA-binding protein [Syntrophorhabdaceae bacterium]|nr:DNA-binding protein [Syntrophorhabdaceae bacterium]MDD5242850.1 DNA-binding protein [Syntrophorhabdaceae bacterium]